MTGNFDYTRLCYKIRTNRINRQEIIFTLPHLVCLHLVCFGLSTAHSNQIHVLYNAYNTVKPVGFYTVLHKDNNWAANSVKNIIFLLPSDLQE